MTRPDKKFILYHTNWATYGRNFQVKDLPIDFIPEIAYAFFNLKADGEVFSGDTYADFEKRFLDGVPPADSWNESRPFYGNLGQFARWKEAGKQFNVQLSVGGWTWSKFFSDAVSTDATRHRFVTTLIDLFKKYPVFNGVSLDWEYLSDDGQNYGLQGNSVRPEDGQHFIAFLKLLRSQLDAHGMKGFHISLCCIAAPEKMRFPVAQIAALIDELHVMTYDLADGNWGDKTAAHQTNLRTVPYAPWSVERAVDAYLAQGVPSTKIFIGAAFYSRGFANTKGIGQPASGGSPDKSFENGICDYKDLPKPGAVELWDDQAKAGYSYDASRKVLNSYDTVQSIQEKCKYVWEKDLGGIIVWESSGDVHIDHPRSLTRALYNGLVLPSQSSPTPSSPGQSSSASSTVPVISLSPSPPSPSPSPPSPSPSPPSPSPSPSPCVCHPSDTVKGSSNAWAPGISYQVGQTITFRGVPFSVVQSHTSQSDWTPDIVPALFKRLA